MLAGEVLAVGAAELEAHRAFQNKRCGAFSSCLSVFLLPGIFLKNTISWVSRSLLWISGFFFLPFKANSNLLG